MNYDEWACSLSTKNVGAPKINNFRTIYTQPELKAKFLEFLTHVYHLYPEQDLHAVIDELRKQYDSDSEIYEHLLQAAPSLKPFLQNITYGLPALKEQKKVIKEQTTDLLGARRQIKGYLEIGTPGRYVRELQDSLKIDGPVYVMNDYNPGFSPNDIIEREALAPSGVYLPLKGYCPIPPQVKEAGGVDLITMYIGLHHSPRERFGAFVRSIHDTLRPGGRFVLRDHDVTDTNMECFVGLAHDVFNAGLLVPWSENAKEVRFFLSYENIVKALQSVGLRHMGPTLAQDGDPTKNLLAVFQKV
jgi:hypothetical protein